MKSALFLGDSLACIRDFPADARSEAGHQIRRVQTGRDPDDWKPLKTVGQGVREMRFGEASGAFRVVYLAAIDDAVVVLHAFKRLSKRRNTRSSLRQHG